MSSRLVIIADKVGEFGVATGNRSSPQKLQVDRSIISKLLDVPNLIIFIIGPDHEIELVNPKACEFLGYTREELIGKNWFDSLMPEINRAEGIRAFQRFLEGTDRSFELFECPVLLKSGEDRIVSWHGVSLTDSDESVIGILLSGIEITEQRFYENLLIAQRDMIFEMTNASSFQEVLQILVEGALRISGLDSGAIYLVDKVTGNLEMAYSKGLSDSLIKRTSHFDNRSPKMKLLSEAKPVYVNSSDKNPLMDSEGRKEGIRSIGIIPIQHKEKLVACLNVSSHTFDEIPHKARAAIETVSAQMGSLLVYIEMEKALRESMDKFQIVSENSVLGHIIVQDGAVRYANDSMARISGHPKDEILRWREPDLSRFIHPNDRAYVMQMMNRAPPNNEEIQRIQYRSLTKQRETKWVEQYSRIISFEGRPATFITLIDITERKRSEKALQTRLLYEALLNEIAEMAVRIDNLEEFVSQAIEKLGNVLEVSRVYICQYHEQTETTDVTYEWVNEGVEPCISYYQNVPQLFESWWMQKIYNFEVINVNNILDLPDLDEIEDFKRLNVKSTLVVPLFLSTGLYGYMGYDESKIERIWNQEDIDILRSIATVISSAIDRHRKEEVIQQEKEFVTAVLDTVGALVVVLDKEGNVVGFNKACEDVTGYSLDEIEGQPIWEKLLVPDERDAVQEIFEKLQSSKSPSNFENHWLTKDGDRILISWSNKVLLDDAGEVEYILGTGIDITVRKRAEKALQESEEMYRKLSETSPDAIVVIDLEGKIQLASKKAIEQFGLKEDDEILGVNSYDLIAPEYLEKAMNDLEKTLTNGYIKNLEYEFLRADGSSFFGELNVSVIRDANGEPTSLITNIRDVTTRKRVEQRLRKVNRALRVRNEFNQNLVRTENVSEIAQKLCSILTLTGGYLFAWIGLLRHDAQRSIKPFARAGREEGYLESIRVSLSDSLSQSGPVASAIRENRVVMVNNIELDPIFNNWRKEALKRNFASMVAIPLLSEAEVFGVLCIYSGEKNAFDEDEIELLYSLTEDIVFGIISVRTRAERERFDEKLRQSVEQLSQTNTQLEQMAKEASLARGEAATYLDLLCHDIANYTTPVQAYFDLIGAHPQLPKSLKDQVNRATNSVEMIGTLISRLRMLTLADQSTRSKMEEINLVDLISNKIEELKKENPDRDIKVNFSKKPSVSITEADERMPFVFESIFGNVIENDPGEVVKISIEITELEMNGRDYWLINIIDRGKGIPDEMKKRVFRRFDGYWELKRSFGIGLFLSRMIIEYHGGSISLENRVKNDYTKGLKVKIMLPKVES